MVPLGLLRVTYCYYLLWGGRNIEAAPAKFLYLFSSQHLEKKKIISVCLHVLHMLSHFSNVYFLVILWTVAHQAPLSLGFSRQEYQSGLLCPSPWDLPVSGTQSASLLSPALAGEFFTPSATCEAQPSQFGSIDDDNVGQDLSLLKSYIFQQLQMTAVKTIICCMLILCQAMFNVFYIHLSVYPLGNRVS